MSASSHSTWATSPSLNHGIYSLHLVHPSSSLPSGATVEDLLQSYIKTDCPGSSSLFSTSVRTTEETTGWSSNCCLHTSLYPNQLANSQSTTDSQDKFCNQGRAYRHTPNKNHAHGFATSATTLKTWTKVTLHRDLEGTSMEPITY